MTYFVTLTRGGYEVCVEVTASNQERARQEALRLQGATWKVKAVERAHTRCHD